MLASCLAVLVIGIEGGIGSRIETSAEGAPQDVFGVIRVGSPFAFQGASLHKAVDQFPFEALSQVRDRAPGASVVAAATYPTVELATTMIIVGGGSQSQRQTPPLKLMGVSANYLAARGIGIALGRDLSALEEERVLPVAIAGASLFENGVKVGSVITHSSGRAFEVIGVAATTGDPSVDDVLMVPLGIFEDAVILNESPMQTTQGDRLILPVSGIRFWIRSKPGLLEEAMDQTLEVLAHYDREGEHAEIMLQSVARLVYARVKTTVTGGLRAATLAVLGISMVNCANLLLVNVMAETRSIGTKRAIGSSRLQIAMEVLLLTVGLGVLGCVGGVGLAFVSRGVFQSLFGEQVVIGWVPVLEGGGIAILGMLIAGVYPGVKAAQIPPARAMREDVGWRDRRGFVPDVRTALSVIAMAIGVVAICLMVGSGYVTQERVGMYLASVGDRLVTVRNPDPFDRESTPGLQVAITEGLAREIEEATEASEVAWYQVMTAVFAKSPTDDVRTGQVVLCTPGYSSLLGFRAGKGRLMDEADDGAAAAVCVLGARVANDIFGEANPIGQTIQIGGTTLFTVVGVIEARPKGVLDLVVDRDACLMIPSGSAQLADDLALRHEMDSCLLLEAEDSAAVDRLIQATESYLRTAYISFAQPLVERYLQGIEGMSVLRARLDRVFGLIGIIALVIAAVGVNNLMMVRAIGRTREIGIRRALGESKRGIVTLFMTEALVVSLAGALLGLCVAIPVLQLLDSSVAVTMDAVAGLVVAACICGTIAAVTGGIYPAINASSRKPSEVMKV
jgi:putative ABC transport system permease protein